MSPDFAQRSAARLPESPASLVPGLGAVLDLLDRFVLKPLRDARETRRAYIELMALDDRQLADIGLRRSEIEQALAAPQLRLEPASTGPRSAEPVNSNDRPRRAA